MIPPQRYWDSDVFLGWLNREADKFATCDRIINDAKSGKVRIVTSTVTYAEVFWIRGGLTQPEQIAAIKALFGHTWIIAAQLDQLTAELARELLFTFAKDDGLTPADAIHLATAIRSRVIGAVETFDTWDAELIKIGSRLDRVDALRGKKSGADLRVGIPVGQGVLALTGTAVTPSSVLQQLLEQSHASEPPSEIGREPAPQVSRHDALGPQQPGSSPTVAQPPPLKR